MQAYAGETLMCAGVVDICLVPEVDFDVPALMAHARLLLAQKSHIVVSGCVLAALSSAQHNTVAKSESGSTA
jgi:hypothetical protein